MILGFAFLSLVALVLIVKKNIGAANILTLLIAMCVGMFLTQWMEPTNAQSRFMGLIGVYLSLNFLAGAFLSNKFLKYAVPIVSLSIFYFLGDRSWMFGAYSLDFAQPKVLLLPVLGIVLMILLDLKELSMKKMFPELSVELTESTVVLVLIGLMSIFGSFLGSWSSFLLIAIGVFAYNSFSESNRNYIVLSLLAFALIGGFIEEYKLESIDLSIGKVIGGLVIGGSTVGMTSLAQKINVWFWAVLLTLMSTLLILLVLLLNNVHPAFGGIETFVASLAGIGIAGIWLRNQNALAYVIPSAVLVGLLGYHDPFGDVIEQKEKTANTNEMVEVEDKVGSIKGQGWDGLQGIYAIDNSSLIKFQLGPKGGVTEGKISMLTGKVTINEELTASSFSVEMKVKNLSTFNSIRDESLMEDTYFNEPKYPLFSFVSNAMIAQADGFVLKGNFGMIGKKIPQEVFLKYVGDEGGLKHFIGKSSLNRTKWGMLSSPQEGDIVDFEIDLYLK